MRPFGNPRILTLRSQMDFWSYHFDDERFGELGYKIRGTLVKL